MFDESDNIEREISEATEFNKIIGHALGYYQREDGSWLNSHGALIDSLPDFSGDRSYAQVVVSFFESLDSKVKGYNRRFFKRYRPNMSAKEICELAASILATREE